ncbi:hypothetical protein BT96DRAFT_883191 [Gymnopus androsaceus JB14]|uniref:Uncharacterized protein n=1 Tax=Gymnopus androsaceus JB14 TaxID=1447944 RepID=A0A6A4GN52_9AGAR|nr:hypothetical protein BT96DRAFT_891483 [Gymnopus androsaceus JB14]KAE9398299.1 hypothetical protein BT96DRAFT_883191 [Gymnopus androsaceus JB14]
MSGFRKGFMKHWYAVEAIPIYAVVGGAVLGASWYLYRLSMGPTIQWTKANPTPWNNIKPNQGTKMLEVNQKFDERYVSVVLHALLQR